MSTETIKFPERMQSLFTPKRYRIYAGGRGGGKSYSIALFLLIKAVEGEIDKKGRLKGVRTLCLREFQNSISDSIHSMLCELIEEYGFTGFTITDKTIRHKNGSDFIFRGLNRNPHSIKSMTGIKYVFFDEAQTASEESLEILLPTIRKEGSELIFAMNPQSSEDPIAKRFLRPYQEHFDRDEVYEDDLTFVVPINYNSNPYFPKVLDDTRKQDLRNMPPELYEWVWEGKYRDQVSNQLIPNAWIESAIKGYEQFNNMAKGVKVVSHDPSDVGDDSKGYAVRHGVVLTHAFEQVEGDANEGCDTATSLAINENADYFIFDADGLGVSLRRQVSEQLFGKKIEYSLYKGSERPANPERVYEPVDGYSNSDRKKNKELFKNKRAQYYWALRDRFYQTHRAVALGEYVDPETMILINPKLKALSKIKAELTRIPLKENATGIIQLESKERMRRMGIPSPNIADAIVMLFAIDNVSIMRQRQLEQQITDYYPDIGY